MTDYRNSISKILREYDCGELISVNDQSYGYANQNYSVRTSTSKLFVRFCMQQKFENIEKEMQLMSVLKDAAFKTAFPYRRKDGKLVSAIDNIPVVVYEFHEGDLPEVNIDVVGEIARAVGVLSGIKYPASLLKENAISIQDSRAIINSDAFRSFAYNDVTESFAGLLHEIEHKINIDIPRGIVHGDVFPDNSLFKDNKLISIIDFEEFAIDKLLFDVGMTINGFCFEGLEFREELMEVFLYEYNSERNITPEEKELIIDYMIWGAVGMTSWHLHQLLYKKNRRQLERVRVLLHRAAWILGERSYLNRLVDKII